MGQHFGITHCYTLECNYNMGNRSAKQYTSQQFRQLGEGCMVSILDLSDSNPEPVRYVPTVSKRNPINAKAKAAAMAIKTKKRQDAKFRAEQVAKELEQTNLTLAGCGAVEIRKRLSSKRTRKTTT